MNAKVRVDTNELNKRRKGEKIPSDNLKIITHIITITNGLHKKIYFI